MKIKQVSVRRLKSHGTYEHTAVELTAEVPEDLNAEDVADELRQRCDSIIAAQQERERMADAIKDYKYDIEDKRKELESLSKALSEMNKWINDNAHFVACYEQVTGNAVSSVGHVPF